MKDLQELASDIYGVLLLASMGGKDDDLAQAVKEAGAKEEHVDLILKSAMKIIEERDNHQEGLNEILTRDYATEDEAEKKAIDYLIAQGVNEQLIDHILIYNTFVIVKAGTEELIAVARKEGYSERQVKKVMRKEMGLDRLLVDRMYDAATLSFDDTTQESPDASPQKPSIEPQKPARGLLLSGVVCIVIAYLSYQSPSAPDYVSYTAFILALVFLRIGMKRFMD